MKSNFAIPVLLVLSLAACSPATESPEISDLTLAQTKSPVQLLRNEAASRVPDSASVAGTGDLSVACRSADDDPAGLERQWQSTVTLSVQGGLAVAHDVAESFIAEDWAARSSVDDETAYRVVLTKPSTTASIHIDADDSQLEVWTNGPCVTTAGAESEEVTSLESSE